MKYGSASIRCIHAVSRGPERRRNGEVGLRSRLPCAAEREHRIEREVGGARRRRQEIAGELALEKRELGEKPLASAGDPDRVPLRRVVNSTWSTSRSIACATYSSASRIMRARSRAAACRREKRRAGVAIGIADVIDDRRRFVRSRSRRRRARGTLQRGLSAAKPASQIAGRERHHAQLVGQPLVLQREPHAPRVR